MTAKPRTTEDRRRRILDAAREVYAEKGGLSAGLRPIAARAGVTTGAIYAVFDGKEDIYAALLEESLQRLAEAVERAAAAETEAADALRAAALAFYDYYAAHPFEGGLGLYQFEPDGRASLGPDRDRALNAILDRSFAVFRSNLAKLGAEDAQIASARLFATIVGALHMRFARRDETLGVEARRLVEDAVNELVT